MRKGILFITHALDLGLAWIKVNVAKSLFSLPGHVYAVLAIYWKSSHFDTQNRMWRKYLHSSMGNAPDHWADMVEGYLSCLCASTVVSQFEEMERMVKTFNTYFSSDSGGQGWTTSLLRTILREYRFLAEQVCMLNSCSLYWFAVSLLLVLISRLPVGELFSIQGLVLDSHLENCSSSHTSFLPDGVK